MTKDHVRFQTTITSGVRHLEIPYAALMKLFHLSIGRWKKNNADYFTMLHPNGINMEISDGNDIIQTELISDFPGVTEDLYAIIDDYGDGVAVCTILLPDEY